MHVGEGGAKEIRGQYIRPFWSGSQGEKGLKLQSRRF